MNVIASSPEGLEKYLANEIADLAKLMIKYPVGGQFKVKDIIRVL